MRQRHSLFYGILNKTHLVPESHFKDENIKYTLYEEYYAVKSQCNSNFENPVKFLI